MELVVSLVVFSVVLVRLLPDADVYSGWVYCTLQLWYSCHLVAVAGSKFRSPSSAASAAVKPAVDVPTSGSEQRDQLTLRQRSHSVGSMLCSAHSDVVTGGITCGNRCNTCVIRDSPAK